MSLKALFAFFLISLIGVAAIASVPLAGPTGDDSDRLGVSPESSSPRNWEIPPFRAWHMRCCSGVHAPLAQRAAGGAFTVERRGDEAAPAESEPCERKPVASKP